MIANEFVFLAQEGYFWLVRTVVELPCHLLNGRDEGVPYLSTQSREAV